MAAEGPSTALMSTCIAPPRVFFTLSLCLQFCVSLVLLIPCYMQWHFSGILLSNYKVANTISIQSIFEPRHTIGLANYELQDGFSTQQKVKASGDCPAPCPTYTHLSKRYSVSGPVHLAPPITKCWKCIPSYKISQCCEETGNLAPQF